MYSEVFQDSLVTLMEEGRLLGASATSLTLTDPFLQRVYENMDNNEHSIQVVVTEQGLVDLRGLGQVQRAVKIIENCAHPACRDPLYKDIEGAKKGHIPHDLERYYQWHVNLMKYGEMIPGLDAHGD
jgi:acyl-CoA hydrolase